MNYATEKISEALRIARVEKGMSQRALCARAGVPQSHISKIENNAVDLRISSLAAIAHALDLELVLVPRKAVPAVKSVTRSVGSPLTVATDVSNQFKMIEKHLEDINILSESGEKIGHIRRQLREVKQFANLLKQPEPLRDVQRALERIKHDGSEEAYKNAIERINALRNTLAHTQGATDLSRAVRPAYRLDGGDDG